MNSYHSVPISYCILNVNYLALNKICSRRKTSFTAKIQHTEKKLLPPSKTQICVCCFSVKQQPVTYLVFTVLAEEQPNLKAI